MQTPTHMFELGHGAEQRKIAAIHREGHPAGLFWLGGYNSDMQGNKALALEEIGAQCGLEVTRFDYMAHGQSSGDFYAACISTWLEDSIEVFTQLTHGPQILVGSSMGGWLALLLNRHMQKIAPDRVAAMVLIAPAVDMSRALVPQRFTPQQLAEMKRVGHIKVPSAYADEPYIYTQKLLDDGDKHLMLGAPIETGCPVHILQGQQDPDVPAAHAQRIMQHLMLDDAYLTLVPDGDHRLSRPQDLAILKQIILRLLPK